MKISKLVCAVGALLVTAVVAAAAPAKRWSIADFGAVADGTTLNTKAIQATIDKCAEEGGGVVVIPKGDFLSGALFVKPKVNVELSEGAVLRASKQFEDFPVREGERFEGHFQPRVTALLNVQRCDGFHLSGPGMLDGNGEAYWSAKSPDGRPRLCVVRNSSGVQVDGVRFMNSPSWNLHLYACTDSVVQNCRFEISEGAKGPSTDGTDIDSCEGITVRDCFYSVNDDCVCLKGNRYDGLTQEPKSPPVKNVHIVHCTFVRGMGALTLGTEATVIQDVEMENCDVRGRMPMLRVKYRPDTPGQTYSNVHVHHIRLDGTGPIINFEPTHGTKVPTPTAPISTAHHFLVENISGRFGLMGKLSGGAIATVHDITLRDFDVTVANATPLATTGVEQLNFEKVKVNGVEIATK